MMSIGCPYCGPRDETEFRYGGQAHVTLPSGVEADSFSDAAWGEALFVRENPKGPFAERWCHAAGCRRWFNAVRDTLTNEILAVYRVGEPRPAVERRPAVEPRPVVPR